MTYINTAHNQTLNLEVGQKYTVILVSEFMANTCRREITLIEKRKVESYAQYQNLLMIIFKEKGKRKLQGMYLRKSMLFFKGWDLTNLFIDSDTQKGFKGNALINLVIENDEVESMREFINKNLVFGDKSIIVYTDIENVVRGEEKVLFLEDAEKTRYNHAVLDRILSNQEVTA